MSGLARPDLFDMDARRLVPNQNSGPLKTQGVNGRAWMKVVPHHAAALFHEPRNIVPAFRSFHCFAGRALKTLAILFRSAPAKIAEHRT